MRYFLELCLKSVERAISTLEAEIIVVDNNSSDDSCAMVKRLFPNVKLIENKENSGFSKGNNLGVTQARGEFICVLNPDTVVAEDTFIEHLKFAEGKENLGIVGCRLINGAGNFLPESKRNIPYIKISLLKLMGNSKAYYASHLKENETGKVSILVGAFMFLKRELYNSVGGFDEDYFMYGEDIDLCYRILKSGFDNYYFADSTIIHFKGESTLKDKQYAKRFFGAMQIFYKKHFKRQVLFDMLVALGIASASVFRKTSKSKPKQIARYIFVSDKMDGRLKPILSKEIIWQPDLLNLKENDEIILDANVLSYKNIIAAIDSIGKHKSLTYKILPNKSDFIIGSDDATSRGEVMIFN